MKARFLVLLLTVTFLGGWAFGLSSIPNSWRININGKPSSIPVHVLKDMYLVSLADFAKLPGWKVTVDLGTRNISLMIPTLAASKPAAGVPVQSKSQPTLHAEIRAAHSPSQVVDSGIEAGGDNAGPPNNVRMTVKAALSSLDELRKALADGDGPDALKQRRQSTAGIVQQAENLLWSLPRTRTLQADLQVALEDLQSQVNLVLALDQTKDGLLPWTHPAAQSLLLKYPDLHPCRIQKGSNDGLDVACSRKMMNDLSKEDFNDVERDLDQYR